jgi:hypothetical protein
MEFAYPKPRQRQQVHAAGTAQPGYGDLLATQCSLFVRRQPTKVAAKCLIVIESPHDSASGFLFQ